VDGQTVPDPLAHARGYAEDGGRLTGETPVPLATEGAAPRQARGLELVETARSGPTVEKPWGHICNPLGYKPPSDRSISPLSMRHFYGVVAKAKV